MARPFLKWPGGKRWLAQEAMREIGAIEGGYYEPFLGGGAIFFALQPKKAVLSDINEDLINAYVQVRDRWGELLDRLKRLPVTKTQFYATREMKPRSEIGRAVRFLYLNRTAFGGMYRLNRDGEFNVPFGGGERTTKCLWSDNLLENASAALQGVELRVSDFEAMIDRAAEGDVVYCDPTYTVAHENNGFVRYNEKNFSWHDQERLANACSRADRRGVIVIVSNAYHTTIRALYPGAEARRIERKSLISRKVAGRRLVHEYLFVLRGDNRS